MFEKGESGDLFVELKGEDFFYWEGDGSTKILGACLPVFLIFPCCR